MKLIVEKNVPTDPAKWNYYKSQAKKKFDVYPSAYANGWAAKQYKAAGGGWKTEESVDEANENLGFEVGDFVHFKSKNKTGMVLKILLFAIEESSLHHFVSVIHSLQQWSFILEFHLAHLQF